MASVVSHAAAGAALSIAFAPEGPPVRCWPVAIATAVLPDLDSFLSYFRYDPTFGHRGFFHSPFLGLLVSFLLLVLFFRDRALFSSRWCGGGTMLPPVDADPGFADEGEKAHSPLDEELKGWSIGG